MSVSSHTKTSVWSFPFIATKRDWEIKKMETEQPQTHWHLHAHTNTHFTCVRLSASHHSHTVLLAAVWKNMWYGSTHAQTYSLSHKENKEKAKRRRVREVKILHLWRVSLWTVCVSSRWDLSNPRFIIRAFLNFEWFGLKICAKLGQTYFISKLLNGTDFTPPQSKTNMHLGHHCNLLELVLKLDALLPLLVKPDLETFQPVVPLHTGWSQRGSLLLQVQHRSLKKTQENWQKAPARAWRMTFRTCIQR